jgi:hemoglobin/transferrin/lactoferrin receptor protein
MISCAVQAQTIQLFSKDSIPIKDASISDLHDEEIVFTDEEGKAEISIFEADQLLQIRHVQVETLVVTKQDLTNQKNIYLFTASNTKIKEVEIPVNSKTGESKYELITQSTSISQHKIEQQGAATSADMLENTGQVLVQKSQFGGGSPIIRGFEASRILLVVDGVRMNNAIYRGGHLQNSISIDPAMLAGTEIIFGPNSLIYGSDALGGVIHFKTKDPKLKSDSNSVDKLGGFLRYQSVSEGKVANIHLNYGNEKWGFFGSVTRSEFGDLTMGENRTHGYTEFGKIPFYVTQVNGVDSMMANDDQNVHKNSGYSQLDIMTKVLFQPKEGYKYKLNIQQSTSSVIPRFDKLNEYNDGVLKYGEWNYGPQNRSLISLSSEIEKDKKLFDLNTTILAFQSIEEDRISRKFKSNTQENKEEDVYVYSFNSDFIKFLDSAKTVKLNYGAEILWNDVKSKAFTRDIATETNDFLETRYPGGGSDYKAGALYAAVQKRWENHLIKGGARYSVSEINATFDTNQVVNILNLSEVTLFNHSVTGSMGYVYHHNNHKFYSSLSSAFKAPNIDDFGKIFEKKGTLTIPNPNLESETAYSGEIGTAYSGTKLKYDVALFYTRVYNLMLKDTVLANGQSEIVIDGETLDIVSNVNNGIADLYGVFASVKVNIFRNFNFASTATITKAEFVNSNEAVPHIPPFYGRSSLNYTGGKFKISLYAKYNGLKKWSESSSLTDNIDEGILDVGTPSWYTFNASIFTFPMKNMRIQVGVENIMDIHYKTFASGISGSGRNIMASVYFTY